MQIYLPRFNESLKEKMKGKCCSHSQMQLKIFFLNMLVMIWGGCFLFSYCIPNTATFPWLEEWIGISHTLYLL